MVVENFISPVVICFIHVMLCTRWSKNNVLPLSSPMLTYSCLLNYRGTLDKPENTDVCKRMVVHEFVLFETQPLVTTTMLDIYLNVTCGKLCYLFIIL